MSKIYNNINIFWKKVANLCLLLFMRSGILVFLMVLAIVIFSLASDNFLTLRNLTSVLRQSVYLAIVSIGQMLVLLTGGFDLSVGTILALSSVIGASVMAVIVSQAPDAIWLAIVFGSLSGMIAGTLVGVFNGIGVAFFNVSPFIMTLGMTSVGFGIALYISGGVPIYGMPVLFSDVFGYGSFGGIPVPIIVMLLLIVLIYVLLNWTKFGRYIYAVGGNIKAATLSGVNSKLVLFFIYVLCAFIVSIAGILLTARLDTGEANVGADMPLQSIAACVIAGVSLRGGIGNLEQVVLGAVFIVLVQNGMNLAQIESYLQIIVLGSLLILAVIADQFRLKYIAYSK